MDAGFFKGTTSAQDGRFKDKEALMIKGMKFPPSFDTKVDMRKVELSVLKPWIAKKIVELLGFEDDVLIEYVSGLLEDPDKQIIDAKRMQLLLTGFLESRTPIFMEALWNLLLSAQSNPLKVPTELLEEKKKEMREREQAEAVKKMTEEHKSEAIEEIRRRERGERDTNGRVELRGMNRGGYGSGDRGGYPGERRGGRGGGGGRGGLGRGDRGGTRYNAGDREDHGFDRDRRYGSPGDQMNRDGGGMYDRSRRGYNDRDGRYQRNDGGYRGDGDYRDGGRLRRRSYSRSRSRSRSRSMSSRSRSFSRSTSRSSRSPRLRSRSRSRPQSPLPSRRRRRSPSYSRSPDDRALVRKDRSQRSLSPIGGDAVSARPGLKSSRARSPSRSRSRSRSRSPGPVHKRQIRSSRRARSPSYSRSPSRSMSRSPSPPSRRRGKDSYHGRGRDRRSPRLPPPPSTGRRHKRDRRDSFEGEGGRPTRGDLIPDKTDETGRLRGMMADRVEQEANLKADALLPKSKWDEDLETAYDQNLSAETLARREGQLKEGLLRKKIIKGSTLSIKGSARKET